MMLTLTVELNGVAVPLVFGDDAVAALCAALGEDDRAEGWPAWMSLPTAAAYLDMSAERVRKLVARRALPYAQEGPGCRIFFNRHELDSRLRAQTTDAIG